jgi:ERCC4-type nuclease
MEITDNTLIVDSREKWTQSGSTDKHISTFLSRHGVSWVPKKLEVGDYMRFGGKVSIDRKHSIEEISKNLTNPKDKKRFMAEVRRAYQLGIRLVVLIESNSYRDVYDLRRWKSKFTPVTGTTVIRQMERISFAYGVIFSFVNKKSVARRICEILEIPFSEKPINPIEQKEVGKDGTDGKIQLL